MLRDGPVRMQPIPVRLEPSPNGLHLKEIVSGYVVLREDLDLSLTFITWIVETKSLSTMVVDILLAAT